MNEFDEIIYFIGETPCVEYVTNNGKELFILQTTEEASQYNKPICKTCYNRLKILKQNYNIRILVTFEV